MNEAISKTIELESSQQELHRLLLWANNNPKDWYRICNSDSYDPDVTYISDLVERLRQEGLYTVIFFVIYSNSYISGMELSIRKTIHECFLELSSEDLIKHFCKNIKNAAAELAQMQDRKD